MLLPEAIDILVGLVEAAGAAVIAIGTVWAAAMFAVKVLRYRDASAFTGIRLSLGRFLALGLEFLLAADVLRTAIAPSFEEIGQLAAIAAIRTALNFFLGREIEQEQRRAGDTKAVTTPQRPPP